MANLNRNILAQQLANSLGASGNWERQDVQFANQQLSVTLIDSREIFNAWMVNDDEVPKWHPVWNVRIIPRTGPSQNEPYASIAIPMPHKAETHIDCVLTTNLWVNLSEDPNVSDPR